MISNSFIHDDYNKLSESSLKKLREEGRIPWKGHSLGYLKKIKRTLPKDVAVACLFFTELEKILSFMLKEVNSRGVSCLSLHRQKVRRHIYKIQNKLRIFKEEIKKIFEISLAILFVDKERKNLSDAAIERQVNLDCSRGGEFYILNGTGKLRRLPNIPDVLRAVIMEKLKRTPLLEEGEKGDALLRKYANRMMYLATQNTGNSIFEYFLDKHDILLINSGTKSRTVFEINDKDIKVQTDISFTKLAQINKPQTIDAPININLHSFCKCDYIKNGAFDICSEAQAKMFYL